MRFSLRKITTFLIASFIITLVFGQVFLSWKQGNENIFEKFVNFVNPFWKFPKESKIFPVKIPVTVTNDTDTEIIPTGKVTLLDEDKNLLQNINLEFEPNNPPGHLTNFFTFNPDNTSIPAYASYTFVLYWKGIGDEYLKTNDDGTSTPTIEFHPPLENDENLENISGLAFYEKIIKKTQDFVVFVKTNLENTGGSITPENPFKISVPIVSYEKTLNTGVLFLIGCIVIFLITLVKSQRQSDGYATSVKWISTTRLPKSRTKQMLKDISDFEKEAQKIIEKQKSKKK